MSGRVPDALILHYCPNGASISDHEFVSWEAILETTLGGLMASVPGESIFLGVLTHPKSRFSLSQLKPFFANVESTEFETQIAICDENLEPREEQAITRHLAVWAAFRFAVLQVRWYLQLPNLGSRILGLVTTAISLARKIQSLLTGEGFATAQKSMLRLRNIALGHAMLWRKASESESDWILILEDDANPLSVATTHEQLAAVIEFLNESNSVNRRIYCDLSVSFSSGQLGIVIDGNPVYTNDNQVLHRVSRPFTNTLCAVLMSRLMVSSLSASVQKYLESPILGFIPIDWLVNMHLMESGSSKNDQSISFYNLDPGLFVQESLK